MKTQDFLKNLFTLGALVIFPLLSHSQETEADKVPFKVKESVLKDFGKEHKPAVWLSSSIMFNTEKWELMANIEKTEVSQYAIHARAMNGSSLNAIYSPDGKIISSREYLKNCRLPENIINSLQNSEYRDWAIKSNYHLIAFASGGNEKEHYCVKITNGTKKKSVYFNKDGCLLSVNKKEQEYASVN